MRSLGRLRGDELLHQPPGLVVGELHRRRLHEVRRRRGQRAADAPVEGQFGAAHRVDDDAGRVGRVPHFQLQLQLQRHVAKGAPFHTNVAPLAVGQPGHVVARPDVDVVRAQVIGQLAGDGVGLGDLLALQPLALQHVVEVHVAAEVELVGAVDVDAAILEEGRQHAVGDGCAELALDVVADDGQAGGLEALAPVGRAGDEDGDAVDESATGLDDLLDVPLRGHLRADGHEVDDDVGLRLLQDFDDVVRRAGGLLDLLAEVLADAVVGHAAVDGHVKVGHVGELDRVVRVGPHRLAEVFADLSRDDVEGGRELDVADVVAADGGVHQTGDFLVVRGVPIIVDALNERIRAIADADNGDAHLVAFLGHCDLLGLRTRARANRARRAAIFLQ